MTVTNLLKPQVDLPVFEWLRPIPQATSAASAMSVSYGNPRYIYFLSSANNILWQYDTYSDSWQERDTWASTSTPSLFSIKAVQNDIFYGDTISATSTTIRIGSLGPNASNNLIGKTISIIDGKGMGQTRTITNVSLPTVHFYGLQASTLLKYRFNQWRGYSQRFTFGTANFPSFLSFGNSRNTLLGYSVWIASPFNSAATNDHFVIESVDLTLNSAWSDIPDASSLYAIPTESLHVSAYASAGVDTRRIHKFIANQLYQPMECFYPSSISDYAIEPTYKGTTSYISGFTASSITSNSILCSGITFSYDRWANHELSVVSGTGIGQKRRIVGNTDTTFFVDRKWKINPDSTSTFAINNDFEKCWSLHNLSAGLLQTTNFPLADNAVSHITDWGETKNISAVLFGGASYGERSLYAASRGYKNTAAISIAYSATGVLDVSVNSAGGTYQIGDLVTLTTTGTNAQAYVTGITGGGAVTSVQLAFSGSGYASGTSNTSGGSGSGLILGITAGKVGNITSNDSVQFSHNDTISIKGCTTDTSFNGNFNIIGINSFTTFSISNPSGSASPSALNSQSNTTLVDASQNWNTNQHVGRILYSSATQSFSRRILSNTATTITVAGSVLPNTVSLSANYMILEPRGFGAMITTKINAEQPYGWATSGTTTTLVDTTKNWRINQWQNCRVRVMCGTGEGNYSIITSNTSNTLTVASWNVATPDATSKYEIMDSFGVVTTAGTTTLTDANKNWETNALVGKRVRITAGSGVGSEATITANTATVLTLSASITTASSSGNESCYTIYEIPLRSTGINLNHLHGLSNPNNKGRWLISPRGGGSNLFDIYDIPTNTWTIGPQMSPVATTLTTGSMYAYDGEDTYLFTKDATGRIYALDLNTFQVKASSTIPYAHNTAVMGQRMNVITTEDGLKYLYIMRHSGQEMWRTLKFW